MNPQRVEDIIGWDVVNWHKCLPYWSSRVPLKDQELTCLELGAKQGGLSLWLALQGSKVVCSDFRSPEETAGPLHHKYEMQERVTYEAINATDIPYENHFDIVIFKSIMGAVSRKGQDELKAQLIQQVHKCLKPGGHLLFAENLEGSSLHRFARRRFIKWGDSWNYLRYPEIEPLFSNFSKLDHVLHGFLGAFGRTEPQRRVLGRLDSVLKPFIPKKKRYIVMGVAEK